MKKLTRKQMERRAKILWMLRHYWHLPNMKWETSRPETFWCFDFDWNAFDKGDPNWDKKEVIQWNPIYPLIFKESKLNKKTIRRLAWNIQHHFRGLMWRVWWHGLHYAHIGCNGNEGGWRTNLCDLLENNARMYEDMLEDNND